MKHLEDETDWKSIAIAAIVFLVLFIIITIINWSIPFACDLVILSSGAFSSTDPSVGAQLQQNKAALQNLINKKKNDN